MSMITHTKTILSGSVASLVLLTLAASSALANTHIQTVTPTTVSSSTNSVKLTSQQTNQITPQKKQRTQQTKQTGCPCCSKMMNNMPGMMNNMPGMMDGQNNQSK